MALKVFFRPQAEADLLALYRYIAETSGLVIAGNYVNRIEVACMSLTAFQIAAPSVTILHRGCARLPSNGV